MRLKLNNVQRHQQTKMENFCTAVPVSYRNSENYERAR